MSIEFAHPWTGPLAGWGLLDMVPKSGKTSWRFGTGKVLSASKKIVGKLPLKLRKLPDGSKKKAPGIIGVAISAVEKRAGILQKHARIFQQVAADKKRIIVVRFTNLKSVEYIRRGFPAKPGAIKAKTNNRTGIVTTQSAAEQQAAFRNGYYVLDSKGIARGRGCLAE
jgi:hypothetical protein